MKPRPGAPAQPKQLPKRRPPSSTTPPTDHNNATAVLYRKRKTSLHKPQPELFQQSLLDALTHELRTPVTSICGAAEQLIGRTENNSDQVLKKLTTIIFESAQRLDLTIGYLLDTGRIASGVVSLKADWCDIIDIFSEIRSHIKHNADLKRVTFRTYENFPLLYIDHRLITRALVNILDNALRNSPPSTLVNIIARPTRTSKAVITIEDEGHGFAPALLRRPFRRFTRGRSALYPGTGLGLSIAREFVEAHTGSLHLSNRTAGGARITVKLPLGVDGKKPKELL